MTAATGRVAGPKPFAPLADEGGLKFGLAASVAPYRNWLMTLSPTTGLMSQAAANTPGQIAAGFCDRDSAGSSTAGAAEMVGRWNFVSGFPNSTASQDSILATDIAAPFYFVDNQTIGKKSHVTGSNRSLGGLVFGLDDDPTVGITPIIWCNPLAWTIARGAALANAFPGGNLAKAIDAGAGTDLAETLLDNIAYQHGPVSAVLFDVAGTTLAASGGTDYKTLILTKRTAADPSTAVTVATVDTKTTAFTQYTSIPFVLSAVAGAIDLLEDDLLFLSETHGGSGAIIPAGKLRVIRKVA